MPHRVANFFRASTETLEHNIAAVKKSARKQSPSAGRNHPTRGAAERTHSYASSVEESAESEAVRMPPTPDSPAPPPQHQHQLDGAGHKHHRLSLAGLHIGRSSKEVQHANTSASLRWKIESPPIVFYGDTETSTGALLSGQMYLEVKDEMFEVETFAATLNIHVHQKRPFAAHCADCADQYKKVWDWKFLDRPVTLAKGEHQFPFSILLDGHLPATMNGPLMSIAYEFKVECAPKTGVPVKLEKTLEVKRSLQVPELPHHSVRVFPPTNVKANVHYPQVIHPIGTNTLHLKLDGIAKINEKNATIETWKLKKLVWRLEEMSKTIAPACERHAPKDGNPQQQQQQDGGLPKKGLPRTETKVLAEKTLFSGWKADYSGNNRDTAIEMELEYALGKGAGGAAAAALPRYACDMRSPDGSEVTHQLMLELVVSQEWSPLGRPNIVTQTGTGRILRMHFATVLTERAGMGISWDIEAPPVYQDVPPSPPAYCEEVGSVEEHFERLDGGQNS